MWTKKSDCDGSCPAILPRIAADRIAVKECFDLYSNFIRTLANEHADSREDAETLVSEIFLDIRKRAERFDALEIDEIDFIYLIIRRHLREYRQREKLFNANL